MSGFAATGASHDVLQFPTSMFANAAAVLNNASLGANVAIKDPPLTDRLTLNAIAKAARLPVRVRGQAYWSSGRVAVELENARE